jgi:hypothetical protein
VHAPLADNPAADPLARPEFTLQASIAESHRCAREIDDNIAQFRDLLDKMAASAFAAHMRQLKASIVD